MKLTVTTLNDEIFIFDVSEDLELTNFKAFCEVESGIPIDDILISHNGRPLTDGAATLKSFGIVEGDVLILQRLYGNSVPDVPPLPTSTTLPNLDFRSVQVPETAISPSRSVEDNVTLLRNLYKSNPRLMSLLKQNNPNLADAIVSGNSAENLLSLLSEQRKRMLKADPMDMETQLLIAEQIKQNNIEDNMSAAMEYSPESFGTVVMLYINCQVNGHPVKAFIDSGAQATIMSAKCAERCNIMRLVDSRWSGVAKGVGVQYVIGRVHMVPVAIENVFLPTSFTILEDQTMDMLLGLDMLRGHLCSIDLERNVLRIGTTGTETPFLPESEVPAHSKLSGNDTSARFLTDDERKLIEAASEKYRGGPSSVVSTSAASSSRLISDTEIKPTDKFTQSDVSEIIALGGFSKREVIEELRKSNGNKTQAVAALFSKSK